MSSQLLWLNKSLWGAPDNLWSTKAQREGAPKICAVSQSSTRVSILINESSGLCFPVTQQYILHSHRLAL